MQTYGSDNTLEVRRNSTEMHHLRREVTQRCTGIAMVRTRLKETEMDYQVINLVEADCLGRMMEVGGSGSQSILFVHGWTCRRDYWRPQLNDLVVDHRVAALDLSGHGESAAGHRNDWSVPGLAEDVLAALDALESEGTVLVGHSMGGAVALEAALRSPLVRAVVLVDTFVLPYGDLSEGDAVGIETPFHQDFGAAMAALVDNTAGPAMDAGTRTRLKREMASADTAWALPLWHNLLRWSPEPAFTGISVPIHAINGDLIPEAARNRCRGRVTEWHLPGTGHFPQMEMPEAFNRRLREILSSL